MLQFSYDGKNSNGNYLPNGNYFMDIRITDGDHTNTVSTGTYTYAFTVSIDTTPPFVQSVTGGTASNPSVTLTAVDPNAPNGAPGSGVASIDLYHSNTGDLVQSILNSTNMQPFVTNVLLPDGQYDAYAEDNAGNDTPDDLPLTFTVCTNPQGCGDPCATLDAGQCQQLCQLDPAACTDHCKQDPSSLSCQKGCDIDPTSPQCPCQGDPSTCNPGCSQTPEGCPQSCLTDPSLPGCPCLLNPNSAACQCKGSGCPPGSSPLPFPPGPNPGPDMPIQIITSGDPNDKTGAQGVGPNQYISGDTPLPYAIEFSNLQAATAPAAKVVITDQLDLTNENLSTLTLGPISLPNLLVTPPQGVGNYFTTVDLRPGNNLLVAINANLNIATGLLTWTFQSLDPATNKPPADPTAGFLPPGTTGGVFFTVMPKPGVPTSTMVQNQATIVFDSNAPMNTPTWSNTVDNTPPTSQVLPLPATVYSSSFTVNWSGTDAGPGLQGFNIFASDNGGPFTVWQSTSATQGIYPGIPGHTYGFYAIATNLVGNTEVSKSSAEATTTVLIDTTPPTTQITFSTTPYVSASSQTFISSTTSVGFVAVDTVSGVAFTLDAVDGGAFSLYTSSFSLVEGLHTLQYHSQDYAGNLEAVQISTVAVDATPPVTTLISSPATTSGGSIVSTSTVFSFSAADPISNGIASGVKATYAWLDGSPTTTSGMTLSTGTHTLQWYSQDNVGNAEVIESSAIIVNADTMPPVTRKQFSTASYISNSDLPYISSATTISLTAIDYGAMASGVAFTRYAVDSETWTLYATPFALTEGLHAVFFQSQDNAGNLEPVNISTVAVDATAPVTVLTSSTTFSLSAVDPISNSVASGIALTQISIDAGPFTIYVSSFTLSVGTHTLEWYSQDHVGNTEVTRSTTVAVQPPVVIDTTSPVALLLSPSPTALGIDQVFSPGLLPVWGTANGNGFVSYTLDAAAGAPPHGSYTLIQSGVNPVNAGSLGTWNTRSLSGFMALRLRAFSTAGKVAVSTATIYIGNPSVDLVIQNANQSKPHKKPVLNAPAGVAVDLNGNLDMSPIPAR